jgi:hypothetical protein
MIYFKGQEEMTDSMWIGGSDIDSEGNWTWLDHKPWQFNNFVQGEPNGEEAENCLEMKKQAAGDRPAGWWNDKACSEKRNFICSYYNSKINNFSHEYDNEFCFSSVS